MRRLLLAVFLALLAAPAWAAVPVVNDTNSGTEPSNVTSHTVNLPATVNSGELLIVLLATDCASNCGITWDQSSHGTWDQYVYEFSQSRGQAIFAKVAAGTEGGGTLTVDSDNVQISAHKSFAIGTWEGTLAGGLDVTTVNDAGGSCSADPPVAGDSWGSVDRKTIAVDSYDGGDITVSTYPSSYTTNQFNLTAAAGPGTSIASAERDQTSVGSQDPGAYTHTGNCSSEQWVASTISVRGTGAAPPAPPRLTLIGIGP